MTKNYRVSVWLPRFSTIHVVRIPGARPPKEIGDRYVFYQPGSNVVRIFGVVNIIRITTYVEE
jgi:hypothetical protein